MCCMLRMHSCLTLSIPLRGEGKGPHMTPTFGRPGKGQRHWLWLDWCQSISLKMVPEYGVRKVATAHRNYCFLTRSLSLQKGGSDAAWALPGKAVGGTLSKLTPIFYGVPQQCPGFWSRCKTWTPYTFCYPSSILLFLSLMCPFPLPGLSQEGVFPLNRAG